MDGWSDDGWMMFGGMGDGWLGDGQERNKKEKNQHEEIKVCHHSKSANANAIKCCPPEIFK